MDMCEVKGFYQKDLLDTYLAFRFLDRITIMACMLLNRAYSVFFVFSGTTKLETKQHFAFLETNLFSVKHGRGFGSN